jgi:hypothetical protein
VSRRGDAQSMASVWAEMPFMRGPIGAARLREWLPRHHQIRAEALARRDRVLAHDWAAKRLCSILMLSRAEQWNGYVPPATDAEGNANTSPTRRAMLELFREIVQAESTTEAA